MANEITIERLVTRFEADISDVRHEMRSLDRVVDRTTDDMESSFAGVGRRISGAFAAVGAGIGATELFRGLLDTNIELERLEARLRTFTRGDADRAARLFEILADTAADLPFTINDTVDAFTRLGLLGLRPSTDAIRSFANVAAAVGTQGAQSLQQVVEAVADATTFEFERLKELGIVARRDGDRVNITLRGVTRSVKANAREISRFFETLGTEEFAGAAAERMSGLEGAISNLGDAFTRAAGVIGKSGFNQVLTEAVNAITPSVVPGTQALINAIDSVIGGLRDIARTPKDILEGLFPRGQTRPATTAAPLTGVVTGAPGEIRGAGGSLATPARVEESNSAKQLRVLQSIDRKIFTNLAQGAVMG